MFDFLTRTIQGVWSFLLHLFDPTGFPPRWYCGSWSEAHGWLHIVSDLGVWSAYVAIPCVLAYFALRRRDLPFQKVFWLFGAFILACGTTHLMEAIIFWHPVYRLAGVIKLFTAIVSWGTVIALVPIVPQALTLRSPKELDRLVKERTDQLARLNETLQNEVAERKRIERELRDKNEWLEVTLSSIGDAVLTTDTQGKVTFLNPIAARTTGWTQPEAVGRSLETVFNIINEQSREKVENPVARVLREQTVVGLANHTLLITKTGAEVPIDDSAAPIKNSEGNVDGVVLVFRDISERRRAEKTRLQLAAIVESSNDAIIGNSLAGVIETWNAGAERLYGYKADEVIGKTLSILAPPDQADELPALMQRQVRGERVEHLETVHMRKDGTRVDVLLSISLIKDASGRIVGASKIARDITESKRADEKFRLAIESAPNGIVMIDRGGRIQLINAQTKKLFGYTADELLGRPVEELVPERFRSKHPDYRVRFFADPGVRPMGMGRDLYGRRKDGSEFPVEIGLTPIDTAEGLLVLGAIVDITDRKQSELALQDADRRKDEFLAMLAHELRNPLAPISNALDLIKGGTDQPTVNWALDVMARQVQHMVRLVDDLLDVSRIMRGKIELRKETVDLGSVVDHAVETARHLIDANEHQLSIELPTEPIRLEADPIRLAQIIANMLNNAAKYTSDGGRISLTANREDGRVALSIKDNGAGISADLLPHIFELFMQGDRSIERSQGGLGIGLTVVRLLTELHGGSVTVHSAGPGQGSEFVVRLPILTQEDGPTQPAPSARASRAGGCRVLIVDDNVDAAQMLARLATSWRHEVRLAHDGPAAIEVAKTFRPHVVLLDIGLPQMNGYDVARHLRQLPEFAKTLLVAMTGYGQLEDRRRSEEAGFNRHLVKPVPAEVLEDLLGTIERADDS